MRQVLLYIAASLDGKIARNDDSLDWLPPGENATTDYGYKEMLDSVDVLLMGRTTYEICLTLGEWHYKGKTTYVFSRKAGPEMIPETELINEDPVAFVQRLKEQPGKNIWLVGGGEIIRLLHDAGLIDKYMIATIPVMLGQGIELFPNINREQKLVVTYNQNYEELIMTHYEISKPI